MIVEFYIKQKKENNIAVHVLQIETVLHISS